jgi:formate hydrogenlyase subunit 3/multisubunit Na+/H+ antiporter MnhD subunit
MIDVQELFKTDTLSNVMALFIIFFGVITLVYSLSYMRGRRAGVLYYLYLSLTMAVSLGIVYANHLVLFIVLWGFLGLLLYLLIGYGNALSTSSTAKKTFIILGGTDAIMILGIALVYKISGTFQMDALHIVFTKPLVYYAYLFLAVGAFAKAGAMPFHTWLPDTAESAPVSVTAFLPAAVDKVLGIYFLYRLTLDMFVVTSGINYLLMIVGSFSIIAAVMMALIQHDLKRLLGYHAVSQVGYMIVGLGTGVPIGIAGGLFHLLNNTLYKSCLFFTSGAVEKKTGTTDLEKLGGLASVLPIAFGAFLIASLAISGVPPFNGFASKWMIYQGIIEMGKVSSGMWVLFLLVAMFGSAFTLASFMKLLHAVFLGQPSCERTLVQEERPRVNVFMYVPIIILPLLCIVFGVFAYRIPLSLFVFPSLPGGAVAYQGLWAASSVTLLLCAALLIGFLMYLVGTITKIRTTKMFVGGEELKDVPAMRVSGTEFYHTIKDVKPLNIVYDCAEKKWFDIYDVGSKITFGFNSFLRYIHNGILSSYLSWLLLGMMILLLLLIR